MARSWSPEERSQCKSLIEQGLNDAEISEILDRTEASIRTMRHRLTIEDEDEVKPTFQDLFSDLKDSARSIKWLCDKYDRSPKVIEATLKHMKDIGYAVVQSQSHSVILTGTRPQVEFPDVSIADMMGHRIRFGVYSDPHSGGTHAQATSLNKFIKYCVEERGIKLFLDPGDVYCGIYGYKGQEYDLMPECAPTSRALAHLATERQIWVADKYIPRYDGVVHYHLGGNHDWWHVRETGIDAVRRLCNMRDDFVYLGYDACMVPLTDQADIMMWHPSGGVAYARSYKLQRKGQEPQAMDELRTAIRENRAPKVRFIIAGHDHSVCLLPDMPIPAIMAGCFEGQTNYLTQKGLFPAIGGWIIEFTVNDAGHISGFKTEWKPFNEVHDDYKDWPIPVVEELNFSPDKLTSIYEIVGEEPET